MKKNYLQMFTLLVISLMTNHVVAQVVAVDLGLSSGTLWANINIGANSVTEYGHYFSWGETNIEGRTDYYKNSDPFYKSTQRKYVNEDGFTVTETHEGYTKYVLESDAEQFGYEGFYDNKNVLDKEDDAAYVLWGEDWMIPTREQWYELETECTWESVTWNDINGFKVVGKNNNYIFIPKGGYNYEGWYQNYIGKYSCYWSSNLGYSSDEALTHTNTGNQYNGVAGTRYMGRLIRPVYIRKDIPAKEKCATPTINYVNGKISFSCETEGVSYNYEITNNDVQKGNAAEVQLAVVYKVRVFATKDGFENSDVATAEFAIGSNSMKGDMNGDNIVNALDVQSVIAISASTE